MQTKLTLRLEENLVRKAKAYARRKETSLSQMVADYFRFLQSGKGERRETSTPITASLRGLLRNVALSEKNYKKYLEEKHL